MFKIYEIKIIIRCEKSLELIHVRVRLLFSNLYTRHDVFGKNMNYKQYYIVKKNNKYIILDVLAKFFFFFLNIVL